jgi:hypothetical protein
LHEKPGEPARNPSDYERNDQSFQHDIIPPSLVCLQSLARVGGVPRLQTVVLSRCFSANSSSGDSTSVFRPRTAK